MTTVADPRIGSELARYRIEALLGRGGMSVVYLAADADLGRRVALKLLAPELALEAGFRERFLRESRLAASIEHPNVIPVYEAGEAEGLLFLAMRYVEGTDLRSFLAREGPLDVERALDIVFQAGNALDAAHARGLIHRDVKPGNILLAREGGPELPEHVYLADFGLTKELASESRTGETGQFMGTADYIAPEQIEGDDVDSRADVYSLGCVLFECLTGRPPFTSASPLAVLWSHVHDAPPAPSDLRGDLPSGLDAVLARALSKSRSERYATCRELSAAAREAIRGPVAAPVGGLRQRRSRRILAGVAGMVLAVALAGVGLFATRGDEGPDTSPTRAIETAAIQRVDTRNNELEATIPLGSDIRRIEAGEGGVYALSSDGGTLLVERIDPDTNAAAARGSLVGTPAGFGVGLDAVWVGHGSAPGARVTELDPRTLAVRREIQMPFTLRGTRIPLERIGELDVERTDASVGPLWATSPAGFAVYRVRPNASAGRGQGEAVWQGPEPPVGIAVGEGGVWIALVGSVRKLDPTSGTEAGAVELPFTPSAIAVAGGSVWVANPVGDRIVRIDPDRMRATAEHRVGEEPSGFAANGDSLWVANYRGQSVTRLDAATGATLATIDVGGRPVDVAADASGVWVAVAAPFGGTGDERYRASVADITGRMRSQAATLQQPYLRALVAGGFENALRVDAVNFSQLAALWTDAVADLEALRAPARFVADQERTVRRFREMIASFLGGAEAIAAADAARLETAENAFQRAFRMLGQETSLEFQELNAVVSAPPS